MDDCTMLYWLEERLSPELCMTERLGGTNLCFLFLTLSGEGGSTMVGWLRLFRAVRRRIGTRLLCLSVVIACCELSLSPDSDMV